jgi:hypothetical protein
MKPWGFHFIKAQVIVYVTPVVKGDVKMNGNILVFKKFIVLTQGTFKVLPARYYKPVCLDESAEEKTTDKTVQRRLPDVLSDAARR